MELFLLGLEALAFTLVDYCLIRRRDLYGKSGHELAKALKPENGMQILLTAMILLTMLSAAAVLFWFYEAQLFFIMKHVAMLGILWPVAVNDYHEYRIPNKMVLMGLACWVILLIPELFVTGKGALSIVLLELIAAGGAIVVCLLCMLISRGSLGMGDLKLMVVMGLLLGIDGLIYAMTFSLIVSFVACVILLVTKKKKRKDAIPFAPFILVGTYISFILSGM